MVRYGYRSYKKHEVAERTDLVTSPPPKQAEEIAMLKQHVNDMNCQEVTITYKPKLQLTTDITLKTITEGLLKNIIRFGCGYFYHEYSDGGHFHYHGILSGVPKKTLSDLRKQFTLHIGRIEIKQISYFESYLRYMTKQLTDIDYDHELNILI